MIDKKKLASLYKAKEISKIWQASQKEPVIDHPEFGFISPNEFRAKYRDKPCPFCGKKMRQGSKYITNSKAEAIKRGYQYLDKEGKPYINKIKNQTKSTYFHQNYITLDHIITKARVPEKMFDADNLVAICWRCNQEKSDNNHFEIQQDLEYIQDLSQAAITKYPKL